MVGPLSTGTFLRGPVSTMQAFVRQGVLKKLRGSECLEAGVGQESSITHASIFSGGKTHPQRFGMKATEGRGR